MPPRADDARRLLKLGDIDGAIWACDRGEAAQLVHAALGDGAISFAAIVPHLVTLWQASDYPCRRLSYKTWLAWFRNAALPLPELPQPSPLRAWRAQVGDEPGLSWSYDRDVALRFHAQNVARGHRDSRVIYERIPLPAIVLHIPDPERELIVDPRMLAVAQPTAA